MSVHLKTTTEIAAPPETVWRVLSDLDGYTVWNPFMPFASGEVAEGQDLKIRLEPPEGRGMTIHPRVTHVEPERELRWRGRLVAPGIFDGEHGFRIEPAGDGARLVHEEHFSGALVPLLAGRLRSQFLPAFEEMNAALKRRAEIAASKEAS
jgi:hypothetical protein